MSGEKFNHGGDAGSGARTQASGALFVIGVILCLTIIGIPFGLAAFALASMIFPDDAEWQGLPRGDDNENDDH